MAITRNHGALRFAIAYADDINRLIDAGYMVIYKDSKHTYGLPFIIEYASVSKYDGRTHVSLNRHGESDYGLVLYTTGRPHEENSIRKQREILDDIAIFKEDVGIDIALLDIEED